MLSSFAIDKENQIGHGQRLSGASKHRKALGDAGYGSKNASAATGKGASSADPISKQRLAPLGVRQASGTKTPSVTGKVAGGAEAMPKQQRRTLGDISNRGRDSSANRTGYSKGVIVKDGSSRTGSSISKKSASAKLGSNTNSSEVKAPSLPAARVKVVTERPKVKPVRPAEVADVEMPLGRLGDEEEALVQRRQERRFAAAMVEPFRASKSSRHVAGGKLEARRSGSYSRPGYSRLSSSKHGVSSENRFKGKAVGGMQGGHSRANPADQGLENAINQMIHDDLEDLLGAKARGGHGESSGLPAKERGEGLSLLAADVGDVDSSPVSPLDDDFLTHTIDLNFA